MNFTPRQFLGALLSATVLASSTCLGEVAAQNDNGTLDREISFDVKGFAAARAVITNGETSIFDQGFGRLRYGDEREGLQFGELVLDANRQLGHEVSVFTSLRLSEDARSKGDVLEAFVRYRPVSLSRWRWKFRAGVFFPEISFENQGIGWSNRFTLTNSASNTWYSEEYRPMGLEAAVERRSRDISWNAAASIYYGNDRSGTALSFRGFSLNDQRIGLFGSLPLGDLPPARQNAVNNPFVESDGRPGFYVQLGFKSNFYGDFTLHATDNRGDTSVVGSEGRVWRIRFINAAYEVEPLDKLTIGAQFLYGDSVTTNTGNNDDRFGTEYLAAQWLLSYRLGDVRFSLRPEYFWQGAIQDTPQPVPFDLSEEGTAVTANVTWRFFKRHEISAEYVATDSRRQQVFMGPIANLNETQGLVNYRYRF